MAPQTQTTFRNIIQACRQFEGEAVYTCLASSIGEGERESGRTVKEVMIRSFGIHVISLAAYGHLMSLQGATSIRRRSWKVLVMMMAFFIVPEVALAQLVWGVWRGSLSWFRRSSRPCSSWYCIATALGAHSSASPVDAKAVPLYMIDPANLHCQTLKYDTVWLGRFILLLLLMVQFIGSLGIWYRIYTVYGDRWNSFRLVDNRNFHLTLGGLTAVINSVLLSLTNLTWQNEPAEDVQLSSRTTTRQDVHTESPRPSGPLSSTESADALPNLSVPIQQKLQIYDIFSAHLDHFFPVIQQRCVEGAIILFTVADSGSWIARQSNPYFVDLSMIIKEKNPDADNICSLRVFEYSASPSLGMIEGVPFLRLKGLVDIYLLPYISSVLVIVSFCSRILARNARLRRYMPRRILALLVFCEKWITGGRSLTSFPCIFMFSVCLVAWYDSLGICSKYFSVSHFAQLSHGTHWDRLHAKTYMYKDPWYDNMYIL